MTLHNGKQLAQIIKESIDNFDITNRFKSSKPCINKQLISSESSFDQSVNDFIIEQLNDSESHDFIKDLTEFGMAASHVTFDNNRGIHIQSINPVSMSYAFMPAVICGLKHNIIIADDISLAKMKEPDVLKFELPELEEVKVNHPHGWYRKFEKKRF